MICKNCNLEMGIIQNTIYLCDRCGHSVHIERKNHGPGSHLKMILKKFGINHKEDCACKDHALKMDMMEQQDPGWCEKNIETIIGWMREEAGKRRLPFIEIIARGLVKLAIKRANKNNEYIT